MLARTLSALLASLAVCGLAACGGDEPTAGEAKTTVDQYFAALSKGDGEGACKLLSKAEQDRLAKEAKTGSCPEAAEKAVEQVPREIRAVLNDVAVGEPEVDGKRATVEARVSDRYASEERRRTVELRQADGAWEISKLPENTDADPVTTCIVGGLEEFESDDSGFWKRQGRADFVEFMRRVCKQVEAEGGIEAKGKRQDRIIERASKQVVRDMVEEGRIKPE
jgi:ketosteroid isomerase-like protein